MAYQTTITKKGQITIPKEIREALNLEPGKKLDVEFERKEREIKIKISYDFLDFARKIKVKRKIDPVKAREYIEKYYERL